MTDVNNVNDLAAMLQSTAEQPDPQAATGGTEEQEAAQTTEAESEAEYADESGEVESDGYEHDDTGEESDPVEYFDVKVDGEELQVTRDELLNGYQRDADYRKKTMTLAEQRKEVEADKNRIGELVQQVDSFIKREQSEVDWDKLKSEDPEQYIAKQEEIKQAEQLKAKALDEQEKHYTQMASRELKTLVDVMGGDDAWSVDQRKTDITEASEYLKKKGLQDSEISAIVDHRVWLIAMDAAKAEKLRSTEQRVKEEVRKAPKSVKPGQKQLTASERKQKEARAQLNKAKGSPRGEVEALAALLKARGN